MLPAWASASAGSPLFQYNSKELSCRSSLCSEHREGFWMLRQPLLRERQNLPPQLCKQVCFPPACRAWPRPWGFPFFIPRTRRGDAFFCETKTPPATQGHRLSLVYKPNLIGDSVDFLTRRSPLQILGADTALGPFWGKGRDTPPPVRENETRTLVASWSSA